MSCCVCHAVPCSALWALSWPFVLLVLVCRGGGGLFVPGHLAVNKMRKRIKGRQQFSPFHKAGGLLYNTTALACT